MLREIGLSEMVKKGIAKESCVFVSRKRGNDELAPPDDLSHSFRFGSRNAALIFCEYP